MNCMLKQSKRALDQRGGFTLMEVILALAILSVSLAALGELVRMGLRNVSASRDETQAQLLCETKLAEITSGILPVLAVEDVDIEDNPDWLFAVELVEIDRPGLIAVRVTVYQRNVSSGRGIEFSLVRWIPDPNFLPVTEDIITSSE